MALKSISITTPNPNPNPNSVFATSSNNTRASSMALLCSSSLMFKSSSLHRLHQRQARVFKSSLKPFGGLAVADFPISLNRKFIVFAASHEDSHSEIDIEKEKTSLEAETEESQEAWKQALASFKEQAIKMQSVSQEAYEVYSKKALVILKETAEQLKIQADKTRNDLTAIAQEIGEEGQDYLSTASEHSPEAVKDIVETFASANDELKDITKMQDFHLGIPYGAILALCGFLSFMITGSISGIRFGVILGGTLLALSNSSLRSQKRGESFPLALKGQAAIASIIFLRQLRLLTQGASFSGSFATVISGAMVAFYVYRIASKTAS